MKKEFVVERQGKMFVLYAGLLDEAHAQGLKSIKTSLLQVPTEENDHVAICHATVETEKGVFSGIGDASPANVASSMLHCIIRMAETRAKARALRDAVNVGVAAFEELSEGDDTIDNAARPDTPPTTGNGTRNANIHLANSEGRQAKHTNYMPSNGITANSGFATPAQVRTIYLIGRDQRGLTDVQIEERCLTQYGRTPAELTKKEASELITALKAS